jgi:hypothetical protein
VLLVDHWIFGDVFRDRLYEYIDKIASRSQGWSHLLIRTIDIIEMSFVFIESEIGG